MYYTTAFSAAKEALPGATIVTAPGCKDINCGDSSLFAPAVAAAGKAGAGGMVVWVGGL